MNSCMVSWECHLLKCSPNTWIIWVKRPLISSFWEFIPEMTANRDLARNDGYRDLAFISKSWRPWGAFRRVRSEVSGWSCSTSGPVSAGSGQVSPVHMSYPVVCPAYSVLSFVSLATICKYWCFSMALRWRKKVGKTRVAACYPFLQNNCVLNRSPGDNCLLTSCSLTEDFSAIEKEPKWWACRKIPRMLTWNMSVEGSIEVPPRPPRQTAPFFVHASMFIYTEMPHLLHWF